MSSIEPYFKALEKLYAELPIVHCQMKCQISCTSIGLTKLELFYIRKKFGDDGIKFHHRQALINANAANEILSCPQLSADGLCLIHERKPAICKIYGACPMLQCPVKCKVTPRMMTDQEGFRWLDKIERLSAAFLGTTEGNKII